MKDNLKTQECIRILPDLIKISQNIDQLIKSIEENKDFDPRSFLEKYLSQFDTEKRTDNIIKEHLTNLLIALLAKGER